jgi:hypothetical protein
MIQQHLMQQANAGGVPTIDIAEATAMTQDLVGEIVTRLEQVAA